MEFKEFQDMLENHLSWYRDQYFGYLIQHMQSGSTQNVVDSDEDANYDDDDDLQILSPENIANPLKSKETAMKNSNSIDLTTDENSSQNIETEDKKRKYCDSTSKNSSIGSEQTTVENTVSDCKVAKVSSSSDVKSTSSENKPNESDSNSINKMDTGSVKSPEIVSDSAIDSTESKGHVQNSERTDKVPLPNTSSSNDENLGVQVSVISEGLGTQLPDQEITISSGESDDDDDDKQPMQLTYGKLITNIFKARFSSVPCELLRYLYVDSTISKNSPCT